MIYFVLGVLGLCFGSFVSALTWRMHELSKETNKGKVKSQKARDLSIVSGRSMCPHCKHQLEWYDLLPLVSWLSLGGRCRYCKKPVSWQYPVLELTTAGLFILSYLAWPYGFTTQGIIMFAGWLVALVGLIALAVYDLRWMLLPNKLVYPLTAFWATIILILAVFYQGSLMPFAGGLVIGGLFWLIFQVSGGRWIGGGDVKISFLLGMLAGGMPQALAVIFLASIIALICISPSLVLGKLKPTSRIPFGPFLITSAIIIFLSHDILDHLINTYIYPY